MVSQGAPLQPEIVPTQQPRVDAQPARQPMSEAAKSHLATLAKNIRFFFRDSSINGQPAQARDMLYFVAFGRQVHYAELKATKPYINEKTKRYAETKRQKYDALLAELKKSDNPEKRALGFDLVTAELRYKVGTLQVEMVQINELLSKDSNAQENTYYQQRLTQIKAEIGAEDKSGLLLKITENKKARQKSLAGMQPPPTIIPDNQVASFVKQFAPGIDAMIIDHNPLGYIFDIAGGKYGHKDFINNVIAIFPNMDVTTRRILQDFISYEKTGQDPNEIKIKRISWATILASIAPFIIMWISRKQQTAPGH